MKGEPRIKSFTTAVLLGLALLALAVFVLYDAYDRRGKRPPLFLRPLLPF